MTDDEIIDGVLQREGGYTNNAADHGGPTNFGITLRDLSAWRGRPCTADDVKNMKVDEARAIYLHRYIIEPGFNLIADPCLRAQLVDFGINSGKERAIRWLQRAIGTPVTGCVDNALLDLLRQLPARLVNNALVAARCKMIDDISDGDKSQKVFEEGWHSRALSFVQVS